MALAMFRVHFIANECAIQGTGPPKHLLLDSSAAKESSTGMNPVCEIQDEGPQSGIDESS